MSIIKWSTFAILAAVAAGFATAAVEEPRPPGVGELYQTEDGVIAVVEAEWRLSKTPLQYFKTVDGKSWRPVTKEALEAATAGQRELDAAANGPGYAIDDGALYRTSPEDGRTELWSGRYHPEYEARLRSLGYLSFSFGNGAEEMQRLPQAPETIIVSLGEAGILTNATGSWEQQALGGATLPTFDELSALSHARAAEKLLEGQWLQALGVAIFTWLLGSILFVGWGPNENRHGQRIENSFFVRGALALWFASTAIPFEVAEIRFHPVEGDWLKIGLGLVFAVVITFRAWEVEEHVRHAARWLLAPLLAGVVTLALLFLWNIGAIEWWKSVSHLQWLTIAATACGMGFLRVRRPQPTIPTAIVEEE